MTFHISKARGLSFDLKMHAVLGVHKTGAAAMHSVVFHGGQIAEQAKLVVCVNLRKSRSETISKVGNIKIMSASSPFFFSPLSPPFSFLSRVVSRLMGVQKTRFRCRSGQNGQIFRSHLFKNPGTYCKQLLSDGKK